MFFISAMQGIPQMSYLEDLTNEEDEFDNIFNGGPNLPDYAVFNLVDLQNGKRLISCLFFPFCSEYCFRHRTVVKWNRFIMQIWFRNLSCDLHDWHLSTFGYCSLKWGLCACGRWDLIFTPQGKTKRNLRLRNIMHLICVPYSCRYWSAAWPVSFWQVPGWGSQWCSKETMSTHLDPSADQDRSKIS